MLICDIITVPHYAHFKYYKIDIYVIVIVTIKLVKTLLWELIKVK